MKTLGIEEINRLGGILNDPSRPLKARFRALFALRNVGTNECVDWVGKCLSDESALLKHELAYCLGQMKNRHAIPILINTLRDSKQEPIVRHEAGEALGAIGDVSACEVLREYSGDAIPEIAETCLLALKRIEYVQGGSSTDSPYDSIDPTPSSAVEDVSELARTLVDEKIPLWDRYAAMFKLRNINTDESVAALAQGLFCPDSALFRHEIAYVLGQLQSPVAIPQLTECLMIPTENCMVRHECAEALGAIATDDCMKTLEKYLTDQARVVRESCEVALDMAEYEQSESLQYATVN